MPLPWKKARISRISRFMADLHPTKPCSSMVVQTGFPTSLVDLFVKNSDRLKKPIIKKKHHRHHNTHHQPQPVEDLSVSDPVYSSGARDFPGEDPVNLNNYQFKTKDNLDHPKSAGRFEIDHEYDESNRDQRGVLYAVFMVFLVVILALISIKILTLGITMSACLLIFLEYIGGHIFRPCSTARIVFQFPFSLLVCNFVRFKAAFWMFLCKEDKGEVMTERREEGEDDEDEEEDSIELNSPAQEIEVAEARFDAVARAERDKDGTGLNLISGRWGYSDMEVEEYECEVISHEKEHSHSRRRRSSREFMKKLVPKKWRAIKKGRKGKETREEYELSSHNGEDKLQGRNEELYNSDSKESCSTELETEKAVFVFEKSAVVNKKERNRGGCGFLLLVALAGLVGGRLLALGLTVASCLIIQLVKRAPKQTPL
ncbi:uncharacterized protein [Euphorbia lathyris]|uniref:uncharacterized protein n=1 Tax=Euphorbia lathyris TaxID=212925 RepID=UPI003313FC4F